MGAGAQEAPAQPSGRSSQTTSGRGPRAPPPCRPPRPARRPDRGRPPPSAPTATPAPTGAGVSQVPPGRPRPRVPSSSPARPPAPPRAPGPAPTEPKRRSSRLARPEWARGGREQGQIKMAVQVVQAVQAVHLESDAFLVCLNHALSTEKEEVMGLCIGEVSHPVSPAGTLLSSPTVSPGWVLPAPRAAEATGTPDSDPWTYPLDGPVAWAPFPRVA